MGDVGRLDDDGYLFLDGRRDDLIISGGVNVYPLEVEQVIDAHPGVDEVAVFGVDDDDWGQRVFAAVVGDARRGRARGWARSGWRRPSGRRQVPSTSCPARSTGKVRRDQLR